MSKKIYEYSQPGARGYTFGISPKEAATKLREIADQIESEEVVLQKAQVLTTEKRDDYAMTFVRLQFHERKI